MMLLGKGREKGPDYTQMVQQVTRPAPILVAKRVSMETELLQSHQLNHDIHESFEGWSQANSPTENQKT
jgi:hypothetical protein